MSSDNVIVATNLSKAFPVYERPVHRLLQMFSSPSRKHIWYRKFEALKSISFEVARGETLGIVGRNGSGKSTLLQIICGTLGETFGSIAVRGRIAALLELGAGFNPEFTGRENVYLNGTVLGLTRAEVAERFERIVEFSEIGGFIDQPVKSYSSGMFVRLAFAVAINVTPDILVVDEALSVGDEAFQRKCFARIQQLRDSGVTVLFVSHSAGVVMQLCDRAILLDQGELLAIGAPKLVISRYHKLIYAPPYRQAELRREIQAECIGIGSDSIAMPGLGEEGNDGGRSAPADEQGLESFDPEMFPKSTVRYDAQGAEIVDARIETRGGARVNVLVQGKTYIYTYRVRFSRAAASIRCGMLIKTVTGLELGGGTTAGDHGSEISVEEGDVVCARFSFKCLLDAGTYFLNAGILGRLGEDEVYLDRLLDAAMFRVLPKPSRLATGFVDFEIGPKLIATGETE
ncbi:ABC transporter ATP-binding protein [Rhodanobacter thiooxydans]|uniref:ABC transporter ATP-binding protein n=1 Tax=Rhodanobacter thiooxydans TaxID=416169 RepID=UPI000587CFA8|nr:ABC transporter ATP-binding protein [Rhodanobacter thiooxydans]